MKPKLTPRQELLIKQIETQVNFMRTILEFRIQQKLITKI